MAGTDPRHAHDQGHAHELFPQLEAVANHAVLAESLAMITGHDDRRSIVDQRLFERLEHPADVVVDECDLTIVALAAAAAEIEALVGDVLRVRIHVMDPQEEWLLQELR